MNCKKIIYVLIALIYTILFPVFFAAADTLWYSNGILPLFVFVGAGFLFRGFLNLNVTKKHIPAGILAVLFSFFLMFGKDINSYRETDIISLKMISSIILLSIVLFFLIAGSWECLEKRETCYLGNTGSRITGVKKEKGARMWGGIWLSFLICWLPNWLANYPGTFTSDTTVQYAEYLNHQVSRSFPAFHTYFIGLLISFGNKITGSVNGGIALCAIVQMGILAGVYTYILYFFSKRIVNRRILFVIWLCYAFMPVIQLFSKDLVRDVLFSAFVLFFGFVLFPLLYETDKLKIYSGYIILTMLVAFITINLRNAAILYLIAIAISVLFKVKNGKGNYKSVFLILAAVLLLNALWNQTIAKKIFLESSEYGGVAKAGIGEMLSIPIQQVVRVSNRLGENLEEKDYIILSELFSDWILEEGYDDDIADVPKANFNQEIFLENPQRYIKEWLSLGVRYPGTYLDAFFALNYKTWYPDSKLGTYAEAFEPRYYGGGTSSPGTPDSKLPWLYDLENRIFHEYTFSMIPLISLIFSPAFMLYILLYCLAYLCYRGKRKGIYLISGAIILHIGTFFCPVVLLRYNLISFMAAPVAIALVLEPDLKLQGNL